MTKTGNLPHSRSLIMFNVFGLVLLLSGCGPFIANSDWMLNKGQTRDGDVILPSANAILDEGSHVTGSVLMLCCNLKVDGVIDGNVLVLSGNVQLGPHAEIGGNLSFVTGNQDGKPGAIIRGKTWHLGQ